MLEIDLDTGIVADLRQQLSGEAPLFARLLKALLAFLHPVWLDDAQLVLQVWVLVSSIREVGIVHSCSCSSP